MTENRPADATATVQWRRLPADAAEPPLVATLPYLEVSLEHPELEPTGQMAQFVPDAVPYELDGEHRVFFWRSALADDSSTAPEQWRLACATVRSLAGVERLPSGVSFSDSNGEAGDRHVLDVDGTIAGGATIARVEGYESPSVAIEALSPASVTLSADGNGIDVSAGSRREVELESRSVVLEDGTATETTPVLTVRYPGQRTIYHPAPGSNSRCFPSFGLDLDRVSQSIAVPTSAGELDDVALADQLGVDLTARPYPERVLWQAFAYAAFDPHAGRPARVAQRDDGSIVVCRSDDGST